MAETVDQVMPYSQLAEQSVLGALLLNKEAASVAAQIVRPDDFYIPAHQEMYEAALDIFNTDKPLDVITLSEQLKVRGTFDKIGGVAYIAEVASSVPTAANLRYYAEIVVGKATLRRLIQASSDISRTSYAGEGEVPDILDFAEQRIFEILENRDMRSFVHINDVLSVNFENLVRLSGEEQKISGVSTGFSKLDKLLGGLHNGNLVLVAARPGMGKTSFALNIAQYAAAKKNVPVAIFSLEMSKEEITNRIWSGESLVDVSRLQNGNLQDDEWERLADGMESLAKAPIYIDDAGAGTVTDMRAKCRRLKRERGLGLVIVDYIQLMSSGKRSENRQSEVSEISRNMKLLAKDLDVPVMLLSQLNRAADSRAGNKPMLSDLRESGAIEQDADVVMMLYREDYYKEDSEKPGVAECIIAKHRNGATGIVELKWRGEFTQFANLDVSYTEI